MTLLPAVWARIVLGNVQSSAEVMRGSASETILITAIPDSIISGDAQHWVVHLLGLV